MMERSPRLSYRAVKVDTSNMKIANIPDIYVVEEIRTICRTDSMEQAQKIAKALGNPAADRG